MTIRRKSLGTVMALGVMALSLQGCVTAALAPAALSLAAEGVSVKSTGRTISENVKYAMTGDDQKATLSAAGVVPVDDPNYDPDAYNQMASRRIAPLPPRKPPVPGRTVAEDEGMSSAAPSTVAQNEPEATPVGDGLMLTGRARSIGDFIN